MTSPALRKGSDHIHGDPLELFINHRQRDHWGAGHLPVARFMALGTTPAEFSYIPK